MMKVAERFLRYVEFDTQSCAGSTTYPSTDKQKDLGRFLTRELREIGAEQVAMDQWGYVTATIPATVPGRPVLGLLAHLDTSPDASGAQVRPRIVRNYDGGPITLNPELGLVLDPEHFSELRDCLGQDLIVTDGATLLGADDKAGIAEIIAAAEYLLRHPEIPHGQLRLGFTPDEEIGEGTRHFDLRAFGADAAYTVDGGSLGEISCENFNAAAAVVSVRGRSVHPGQAKGKMVNAALIAMEFHSLLPPAEAPQHTEGREGFWHLTEFSGNVSQAQLNYIIRDHDATLFQRRKQRLIQIRDYLNEVYGAEVAAVEISDSYRNMLEKIQPHWYLVENAIQAMAELGVVPRLEPIRGGTDGARLSHAGLPCPNLCSGSHYAHGPYEFTSIQEMETIARLLVKVAELYGK